MANHSHIRLKAAVTSEDIERAADEINQRRFEGRMRITSPDGFSEQCGAERAWILEAPDSRPKAHGPWAHHGPCDPNENLGFAFWLHKDGLEVEVRHVIFNPWIRWVQDVFRHELAKSLGVDRFDGGDGRVQTRPEQFSTDFYSYAVRNFAKPLSASDQAFIKRHFYDSVPESYRVT